MTETVIPTCRHTPVLLFMPFTATLHLAAPSDLSPEVIGLVNTVHLARAVIRGSTYGHTVRTVRLVKG